MNSDVQMMMWHWFLVIRLEIHKKLMRNEKNGCLGVGYFGLNLWRSSQNIIISCYVFYHEVVAKWYYGW